MQTYTYTIFDGDPSASGPCSWPSHEDVEIRGRSLDAIEQRILAEARRAARTCGQYQHSDRLWALIWDADGISVRKAVTTVGGR